MTCEVAVLNKVAVVLAADSALTTTNGKGEARYSKGANKIFQLSNQEPIGIMIYSSAHICGVPWEVVIKSFRNEHLKTKCEDKLENYAHTFFNYLQTATGPLNQPVVDESYTSCLNQSWLHIRSSAESDSPEIFDVNRSVQDRQNSWNQFHAKKLAEFSAANLQPGVLLTDLSSARATPPNKLVTDSLSALTKTNLDQIIPSTEIVDLAIFDFFLNFKKYGETGIVISGYGKTEYFPISIEYEVFGFIGTQFIWKEIKRSEITVTTPSAIMQFATSDTVDAFVTGVGLETWQSVQIAYETHVRNLVVNLAPGIPLPVDIDTKLANSKLEFMRDWFTKSLDKHWYPLRAVVASLPIEEMTDLAETLVVLESLKERVTSPSQSVGGPVDVAVITKTEGLVWIKRKHFFDAEKNSRFFTRMRAMHS